MFYPGQEQEYLAKIQKHFSYPINIYNIQDINLDSEQIGRLRQDQSVMLYKDSATVRGTTISIVSQFRISLHGFSCLDQCRCLTGCLCSFQQGLLYLAYFC